MRKQVHAFLLTTALLAAVLPSCTFIGQEDLFEQSATERVEQLLRSAGETLVDSEYGWVFNLYPGAGRTSGGYVLTMRFHEDNSVDVQTEIQQDLEISSYYRLYGNDGPVLTFDTYNDIVHVFSTPTTYQYRGMEGEYEFILEDVTPERIRVRGRKTGNVMYLDRLHRPAEAYLKDLKDLQYYFVYYAFQGVLDDQNFVARMDYYNRQIRIEYPDGTVDTNSFAFTDEGISFYEPITIGTHALRNFKADLEKKTLTCIDPGSEGLVLDVYRGEGFRDYEDYPGDYTLYYMKGQSKIDVTLSVLEEGRTYLMTGINPNYQVVVEYDLSEGGMIIRSQQVGTTGSYSIYFSGMDRNTAFFSWHSAVSMKTVWNMDEEHPEYKFVSNFEGANMDEVNSFCLSLLTEGGQSAGTFNDSNWAPRNGQVTTAMYYWTSLIRK
ncbi:MAG: DUF4302 domain-containing protein [Bacteroidales bacterium]|nr:DUF4302 domain-containing protein [Bacteroidales bacterium]